MSTIWLFNIAMENPLQMEVLMGKLTIPDAPCRVYLPTFPP